MKNKEENTKEVKLFDIVNSKGFIDSIIKQMALIEKQRSAILIKAKMKIGAVRAKEIKLARLTIDSFYDKGVTPQMIPVLYLNILLKTATGLSAHERSLIKEMGDRAVYEAYNKEFSQKQKRNGNTNTKDSCTLGKL